MIDKIIMKLIDEQSQEKDVAVLLSGGVDSISVSFAAHRLGKTLHCYSFYVNGKPSKDFLNAESTAKAFNWNFTAIDVPVDNIEKDFFTLIHQYKCEKKTQVECTWPFLYIYPRIEQKELLTGWGADGWYGVSKKAHIHYKEPKEKFDEFRNAYFGVKNPVGIRQQEQLAREYNIKWIAPYFPYPQNQKVKNFMMKYDWYEMNTPKQKQKIRESFAKEFEKSKARIHENLQLAAGIPDYFEKLLDNKEINFYNRKRIMDVIRDWNNKGQSLDI